MKGFKEFEFDLPEALLVSLVRVFDGMEPASLLPFNLAEIPDAQGLYQLLLRDRIVYIGKTDAEAGLRKRLERHSRAIQHRANLHPAEVMFKAVRVFVFTAIDLETQLIRHYRTIASVAWNSSGFGSNDPGRERDTTNTRPEGYDASYPINIDRLLEFDLPTPAKASTILALARSALPYTFRVETLRKGSRQPHPELAAADVTLPSVPRSARMVVEAILSTLPAGWQATLFPGRIIMYRENREYLFGIVIGRS